MGKRRMRTRQNAPEWSGEASNPTVHADYMAAAGNPTFSVERTEHKQFNLTKLRVTPESKKKDLVMVAEPIPTQRVTWTMNNSLRASNSWPNTFGSSS